MSRAALAAAALLAAAAPIPGAAATGGMRLSASPVRLTLTGAAGTSITVRNPGSRPLFVNVSRAGFARSLRGRPQVRAAKAAAAWLQVRPRRVRLAPHAAATVHVAALPPPRAEPGDHPALVLLTTRPVGAGRVRVRLRVGIVVLVHVPGRIVRRLEPRALTVRRRGSRRLLDLRLANRGNVVERLGGGRLRLVLLSRGRTVATLRPRRQELLPHTAAIAEFVYRGRVRGAVVARVKLSPPSRGRPRAFRIRI